MHCQWALLYGEIGEGGDAEAGLYITRLFPSCLVILVTAATIRLYFQKLVNYSGLDWETKCGLRMGGIRNLPDTLV
jgi:hypothetical protein